MRMSCLSILENEASEQAACARSCSYDLQSFISYTRSQFDCVHKAEEFSSLGYRRWDEMKDDHACDHIFTDGLLAETASSGLIMLMQGTKTSELFLTKEAATTDALEQTEDPNPRRCL
ncbi:uncharacterized protein RAG0_06353 [Rhynchosporium agropyri]|uniref:Uncharacterized protein n=1 Tax=Rhynchosporium agropyri TaxID=914238 RepID=A0A1E1KGS5_9HELO|nr:uncharacterized protein RAG0_06353 [Rhynchosporium agropyri]